MQIYDRPTKVLMREFSDKQLKPGQVFHPKLAIEWFSKKYPKTNPQTVALHVEGMSVNSRRRFNHRSIKPGSKHDLFFKLGPGQFRLWISETDPKPIYKTDLASTETSAREIDEGEAEQAEELAEGAREFAFERDLKNYLARNLGSLEPGLKLYEDEGLTGIEFPVEGRFIDILAVGKDGALIVVELKVSRGYDRTLGQLMRYMGWIRKNLAESRKVRGIIVASGITEDLRLAAWAPNVKLVEYEISFKLKPVEG